MSPDKLTAIEQMSTGFIRQGQSEVLDNLRDQAYEGREKLEANRKYINSIVKNAEKNGKEDTQYVKIHETAKSDPNFQLTQRRAKLFMSAIQKKLTNRNPNTNYNQTIHNHID